MNFHIKPFHTLFKKRTEGFRFSEAICEKAIYTAEFKKYQPLQLDGDPAVAEYLPNNQANTVCNQLLNQAEERGNNARSLLNAYGLEPGTDLKEYWRQVEQWLPSLCEQSQEPEHLKLDVARRPLRPMAQAFIFDLAFAYAQTLLEMQIGLRFRCADKSLIPPNAKGLPAFPVIVDTNDKVRLYPGSLLQWVGVNAMAGQQSNGLVLGIRGLEHPSEDLSPHEITYQWVDAVYKNKGRLPTVEELADFAMDYGWHADDVPQELIERIEQNSH